VAERKALRQIVVAAGIVVVLLGLWQGWRLLRARRPLPPAVEQTRELPPPRLRPTTMPTTHPSVDRWLNDGTYVTSDGRMIETSDVDSDGLYDVSSGDAIHISRVPPASPGIDCSFHSPSRDIPGHTTHCIDIRAMLR